MEENSELEAAIRDGPNENGEIPAKKKRTWKLSKQKRRQVTQSIVLYIGFFTLGLGFSVVGPTLLDLERITNTDTKTVSLIFTSRSVAGLAGAIMAGALIPRLHHWLLMALSLIIMGALTVCMPYIRLLPLLCVVFAGSGIVGAMYDAGGNMVLLKVWGKENGPWMQALHCIFGLGALMGPLVAEPFLQDSAPEVAVSNALPTVLPPVSNSSSIVYQDPSGSLKIYSNSTAIPSIDLRKVDGWTNSSIDVPFNQTQNTTEPFAAPYETNITWAYLIIGIACIVAGMLLMSVVFCCSEIKLTCLNKLREKKDDKKAANEEGRNKKLVLILIILLFMYYLTYCILEMNVGHYLTAYAVRHLGWSEKDGAKVTSGYWGMFTAGRAAGILLVSYVSPAKLIICDMTISVLSLGTLMFLAQTHPAVLWVCTLVLGLGISTIFATGITWAEKYLNVSGGVGAIFMIAGAGGEMVGPILIGILFDKLGPQVFVYVMFTAACLLVILFGIMMLIAKKLGKRKLDSEPVEEMTLQGQGSPDGTAEPGEAPQI